MRRHGAGGRSDRRQVQPCGGAEHPEGHGGGAVQDAGRAVQQRRRTGRGLSEQHAVQGQGRDGGAATGRRGDHRSVAGQVRAARAAGVRGLRPALHLRQLCRSAQGDQRPARCAHARIARAARHHRAGLLGQRFQVAVGQCADSRAGRPARQENAHPVLQGARCADAGAGCPAAGDRLRRGLCGAQGRGGRTAPRTRIRISSPSACTRCSRTCCSPSTATSATR